MPVTVPLIEKTVQTTPLGATPLGASLRPLSDPYIKTDGAANLGKALQDVGAVFKARGDQTALLEAQKKMDDWEATNIFDPNTGALAKKGKNAMGLPGQLTQQYGKDMNEIYQGLSNADQQEAFDKMALSRRDNIQRTLMAHERGQMDDYRAATASAAQDSSLNRAALNWNNPSVIQSSIEGAKAAKLIELKDKGLDSPDIVNAELSKVEGKAHLGVLTRMGDANPKAAVAYYKAHQAQFGDELLAAQRLIDPIQKKYEAADMAGQALGTLTPKTSEQDVIKFIVGPQIEGGDVVAKDGDGIAHFGINSKAHPGVDVKNLNADQAYSIAKTDYWDQYKIGDLPPQMRLVVFDRVFNGYDPKVTGQSLEDMIKAADGDPRKFLDSSAAYLQKLAIDQPEKHAKDLKGWMQRIGKLNDQVDAMYGAIPDEQALHKKIDGMTDDIELATAAKQLVTKNITDMRQARTQGENDAARQVATYQLQGQEAPPSLVARLSPEQQKDLNAKVYDPMEYERVRRQVAYGQPVDLDQMRFRLSPGQYNDLVKMQGDPVAQQTARLVDARVQNAAQQITGKSIDKVKTKDDFQQLDTFRKTVYSSIDAYTRLHKAAPDREQIDKIVDGMILKPHADFLQSPAEASTTLKGIPRGRSYMIGGEANSYEQVVSLLSQYARARNIPVTPENLGDIYSTLKAKKLIVEQYAK